ncbi:tetratricopeptide repeat protein [Halovivax gelatinilyticus]|uniref:tetratricopeptide repeat protein n=1 Tax=Halovivax gelatinilyticus TaxID=2961597 RepID=UPI0020CA61D8|nr:tetratricopeptide repeat protein [Halovivax gelatinilyticus]
MAGADRSDETVTLISRLDLLDRLCEGPAHVRDIIDETGQARSTVHRAVTELTELGLVRRGDDGIEATITGRFVRDQLVDYLDALDDVLAAREVLEPLSPTTDIPYGVVVGADGIPVTEPAPYRPADRMFEDLRDATTYRALLPTIEESRTIRTLYEHVITRNNPAELVVSPAVFETLRSEFSRRMTLLAESDRFTAHVGAVPPYGLGLFEREPVGHETRASTVHVVVHNESGGVHGLLVNDTDRSVSWAEAHYERYRDGATDRTDELQPDTDGGTRAIDGEFAPELGQSLPVSLEREGFVRIDDDYFHTEPVAAPPTAWRTGLSLAEVHTGYAIDRSVSKSTDEVRRDDTTHETDSIADESPDDRSDLADEITAALGDGTDTIVLGPPGSGKSTICKQVACAWYAADRGPVIYRDGQHGRTSEAVDDLVDTVTAASGHALVVVEDAVRPDAEAIFEVIERVADRTDVSVLLDARESEWNRRLARATEVSDLEVMYVPPIREADCARLVEHFERTLGRHVDVPTERLWSTFRDEIASRGGDRSHEMLRLIHRLSTYADPLTDEPTALEEAVAGVYDELKDDELVYTVCLLVNVLNAAGIGVDRRFCYAVGDDDLDAVDGALERLYGRVLFPTGDGRYRAVHEAWSTAFLENLLDVEGEEAASEQFEAVVGAVVGLADDPERRERIAAHLGERWALDDPRQWVPETIDAVYALGQQRSQIAPLFGDGTESGFEFPEACPDRMVSDHEIRLGEIFLAGGYYDRAERAFERVSDECVERSGERLLGLARVALNRGEYDAAIECCRSGLSLLEDADQPLLRARTRLRLGEAVAETGAFDEAKSHYETALAAFRTLERPGWEAQARHRIGAVAFERGAYERAREWFESSLVTRQELGDRRGEAEVLNSLGNIAMQRGSFDRAATLFERTLDRHDERGDRHGVAKIRNNLGAVEFRRENEDRAIAFYERSLEDSRAIGDRPGAAKCLHNLGILEERRGNYDRATDLYEQSLDSKTEIGDRPLLITTLTALGSVEGRRGNYVRAADYQERALDLIEDLGDRHGKARCLHNLGQINNRQGNVDRAITLYEQSLDIKEELGDRGELVLTLTNLGLLAARRGALERARSYGERALDIATEVEISEQIAGSHHCLGEVARLAGEHDLADERLERALDAIDDRDGLVAQEIRLTAARLERDRGDSDRARAIAHEVLEGSEALDANFWVAQANGLLGRIEADEDPETAREHLREALAYYERVDAIRDALEVLKALDELPVTDVDASEAYHARTRDLLADAPEEVRERHGTWVTGE